MKIPEVPKMPDLKDIKMPELKLPHMPSLSQLSQLPILCEFPQIKKTVFGGTLKTGVIVVAVVSILIGAISVFSCYDRMEYTMNSIDDWYSSMSREEARTFFHHKIDTMMRNASYLLLALAWILCNVVLICSLRKYRPVYVLLWLVYSAVGLTVYFCRAFYSAFFYKGIDAFVFQIIVLEALWFYAFQIVYSYFLQKTKELSMNNGNNTNNNLSHQVLTPETVLNKDVIKPTDSCIA